MFALTVMATSVSASAEPHAPRVKPRASAAVNRALLKAADSDRDDHVSVVELEALVQRHVQQQVQQRFSRLDRDRDGRVTKSEVPTMSAARFTRFDLDSDESFTVGELAQVMEVTAQRRCQTVVAQLDLDKDGALTARDLDGAAAVEVAATLQVPPLRVADSRGARK